MKEAINHVGDRFGLPNGWLNADFMKTALYSPNLSVYSVPYHTYNQVLKVRVVTGEYLIAMKLRAGRKYKYDISDIVGILAEQKKIGKPITYEMIDTAVKNLYGGWDHFPKESIAFLRNILALEDYSGIYEKIRESEIHAKEVLLDSRKDYPDVLNKNNPDEILEHRSQQENRQDILADLRKMKR